MKYRKFRAVKGGFEEKKSRRQAFLFGFLSFVLFIILLFWGFPVFIRLSIFFADLKDNSRSPQKPNTTADIVPFPPGLESIPSATNSAKLSLRGFSAAGYNIKVFLNDELLGETLASSNNTFIFPISSLTEGTNQFYVVAFSPAGKSSQPSPTLYIVYKKSGPKLELTEPAEGMTYSGSPKEARIVGKTDSGVNLTVNDRLAIVNADGSFFYRLPVSDGETIVSVTASDAAGNKTSLERRIRYNP